MALNYISLIQFCRFTRYTNMSFTKNQITGLALIGLIIFAGISCEKLVESPQDLSLSYYPLKLGGYKIYQVDSVVYDEYNCLVDTVNYQLKEIYTDTIYDGEGALSYRIERLKSVDTGATWNLQSVWFEKYADYQIQRVQDNQRFILFTFPAKMNRKWDGLVYIRKDTLISLRGGSIDMFKDWDDFEMMEIDEPYADYTNLITYDSTILIIQADKINNIERRYSIERYAKNIGLIYKEQLILDTQCRLDQFGNKTCSDVGDLSQCLFKTWEEKAEKGFIVKQVLIEHNY